MKSCLNCGKDFDARRVKKPTFDLQFTKEAISANAAPSWFYDDAWFTTTRLEYRSVGGRRTSTNYWRDKK